MARENKEEAIQRIIDGLHCSREEAEDVFKYDQAIDHDEKTDFDLTAAQQKVAQTYVRTGTRKTPTVYTFTKRERKPNATKGGIVAELAKFLEEQSEFSVSDVQITNKERQIAFTIGSERFELTLVQKRKPKA